MNNQNAIILLVSFFIIVLTISLLLHNYIKTNIASGADEINRYLSNHCDDPAVLNVKDFPWTKKFRKNWKLVQGEYLKYCEKYEVPRYADISKSSSGNNPSWKAIFLRVFSNDTEVIEDFPETKKLIDSCPCTTAYFSMIEPRSKLTPHVGIFKGVVRYHLSLIAPKDWKNCFIVVDGNKLHWKEPGNAIMFDDMFLHHVENNTDERRVVLFLDIKRDFKSPYLNLFNTIMLKYINCNDALVNTVHIANKLTRKPKRYPKRKSKRKPRSKQ